MGPGILHIDVLPSFFGPWISGLVILNAAISALARGGRWQQVWWSVIPNVVLVGSQLQLTWCHDLVKFDDDVVQIVQLLFWFRWFWCFFANEETSGFSHRNRMLLTLPFFARMQSLCFTWHSLSFCLLWLTILMNASYQTLSVHCSLTSDLISRFLVDSVWRNSPPAVRHCCCWRTRDEKWTSLATTLPWQLARTILDGWNMPWMLRQPSWLVTRKDDTCSEFSVLLIFDLYLSTDIYNISILRFPITLTTLILPRFKWHDFTFEKGEFIRLWLWRWLLPSFARKQSGWSKKWWNQSWNSSVVVFTPPKTNMAMENHQFL